MLLSHGGAMGGGPVAVLKFGSSLLRDEQGFCSAVAEVAREVETGSRVVVVVSAVKGTTDRLTALAQQLADRPAARLLSLLLRTGEDASVALLGIALVQHGLNAHALSGDELGLRTTGPLQDADPKDANVDRLEACLHAHDVVVVPGFVGRDVTGHPSVLGRGGSDLTALFLGERLAAKRIRLIKDVDGVYPTDPRSSAPPGDPARGARSSPAPLKEATWSEVERIGNGVVQPKALWFAERAGLSFRVSGVGGRGTLVRASPEAMGGAS
jgi:homoserine dehydrogenase